MSDLDRRSGSRLTRKQREDRAYRLLLATGGFGGLAVVAFVLSLVGIVGGGLVVLLVVLAIISGILFRRTLRR